MLLRFTTTGLKASAGLVVDCQAIINGVVTAIFRTAGAIIVGMDISCLRDFWKRGIRVRMLEV
jgi:hypothetical protein